MPGSLQRTVRQRSNRFARCLAGPFLVVGSLHQSGEEAALALLKADDATGLEVLLEREPALRDWRGALGDSLLHAAILGDAEDCARLLVRDPALANAADRLGETALHLAAQRGRPDQVRLLRYSIEREHANAFGWTALHFAAALGHEECVDALSGSGVLAQTALGRTPLHLASRAGNAELVDFLIRADARRPDDRPGTDPADLLLARARHTAWLMGRGDVEAAAHLDLSEDSSVLLVFMDHSYLHNPFARPQGLGFALWQDGVALSVEAVGLRQFHRAGRVTAARRDLLLDELRESGMGHVAQSDADSGTRIGLRDGVAWLVLDTGTVGHWGSPRDEAPALAARRAIAWKIATQALDGLRAELTACDDAFVRAVLEHRDVAPARAYTENPWKDVATGR